MNGPPIWQRLLAALAYTLPWSDALGFGSSLLGQFPWLNLLILPALPMLQFKALFSLGGLGIGSLLLFLLLYAAESLRKGYQNNRFEVEARDAEHPFSSFDTERKLLS
jgi:hypothetical protein